MTPVTQRGNLIRAWGEWVSGTFEQDHSAHLTFQSPVHADRAFLSLQSFADSLVAQTQGPVPWVAFAEPSLLRGVHLHAFLRGTASLTCDELWRRWRRNGFARFRIVRSRERRAFQYAAKLAGCPDFAFEFSPGFQRAHRRLDARDQTDTASDSCGVDGGP